MYCHNETNKGATFARNMGNTLANGEYLFFCDSDVTLDKTIFMKMIQTMHLNPKCSWTYCNYFLGQKEHRFFDFDYSKLKKLNFCSTMSLIRNLDFPKFDEKLKRLQDWDLFLTMAKNNKYGVWIDNILFSALDRNDGITRNSILWEDALKIIKEKHKI